MTGPNFFDEGSPFLEHPLLTPERTSAELEELATHVVIPASARVLDLGSGFGRHAVALAKRGHDVVAVDPSPTMCRATERAAAEARVNISVLAGTASTAAELGPFDLVLALFSTFGQIGADNREPSAQLADIVAAMTPGAHLVIEVPDRRRALGALVSDEELGPTRVTRRFDPTSHVLHETFETPSGDYELALRLFDRSELEQLLADAGLQVAAILDRALVPPPPTMSTFISHKP